MAITIPNTFVAGTKIEASPMNANFAEVANAVDKRGDTVTGNIAANAGVKFDGVDLSTIPNSSGTFDPLFAQVVIGTADTNGIRLDLETGTLAVREGDDSAYAPINTGTLTVTGAALPASDDGGALGSGTKSWSDLFLASGGVINLANGDVTVTHSSNTLAFAGAATGYTFADGPITNALGAVGTPSYTFTGDLNTGLWSPAADTVAVSTGGSERWRTDSVGRLLIDTTTARTFTTLDPLVQIETAGSTYQQLSVTRNSNDTGGASLIFGKSRGTTLNSNTVVADGDSLGSIRFQAADGVDMDSIAAQILAQIDGAPGSNDTPGRLIFSTAADGAASVTERMRIDAAGNVGIDVTPSYRLHVRRAGGAGSLGISVDSVGAVSRVSQYFAIGDATNVSTGHAFYTRASTATDNLALLINNSQGVQCANTLSVGAVTPATTGAGITFPAAQSASSDANTLDDYEEGTWTGTLKGSTSDPTTPVTATGRYTKIGRLVTVVIAFDNITTTGAAGSVTVTGLPFANGAGQTVLGTAYAQSFNFNGGTSLTSEVGSGSSTIAFGTSANNAAIASLQHTAGTSRYLNASITYFV